MPRVLGLDVGDVRIGVALSDATGMLASPLTIIEQGTREEAIREILKIVKEREVELIITGMPYSLDGTTGPQALKVQVFIDDLRLHTDVPVEIRDERFTTATAVEFKQQASKKKLDRKTRYDAMAAAVILQSYLVEKKPL